MESPAWWRATVGGLRTYASKAKAHISKKLLALKYCLEFPDDLYSDLVRLKITIKQLTRVFLRKRKDYSSEVLEQTCKTHEKYCTIHMRKNILQTYSRGRWHYSKYLKWLVEGGNGFQMVNNNNRHSAFYNTVMIIIQMALSAQEPVLYCQHGFVSFLLGRYIYVSCNAVFKRTNAYKSYRINNNFEHLLTTELGKKKRNTPYFGNT